MFLIVDGFFFILFVLDLLLAQWLSDSQSLKKLLYLPLSISFAAICNYSLLHLQNYFILCSLLKLDTAPLFWYFSYTVHYTEFLSLQTNILQFKIFNTRKSKTTPKYATCTSVDTYRMFRNIISVKFKIVNCKIVKCKIKKRHCSIISIFYLLFILPVCIWRIT